ncbi:BTB/POZ domain-containing protein KCTD14 isoform 1-T1 [Synchiropus picturatus]
MSLPDFKTGKRSPAASSQASVVHLNVGGHMFTTSLSTLTRHPGSKLGELVFRETDSEGRVFIDRDGAHFGAVLDFLRTEQLPSKHILEVHREAVHYNVQPLVKRLEETPQMFGELVARQQFLTRVPHYWENIEVLIRIARAEAVASRHSTVLICVLRTEEDLRCYDNVVHSLDAEQHSVVTFGPWKATPGVSDLLDCVRMDIQNQGYQVQLEPHTPDKSFRSKTCSFFHKLTFTWW